MDLKKIKQEINSSNFALEYKQELISLLPELDKNTQIGLVRQVTRADNIVVAKEIVGWWKNFAKILTGLKATGPKTYDEFYGLLKQMQESLNDDVRLYFLYLVLDVRNLFYSGKIKIPQTEYVNLLKYELDMFWNLPKDEVFYLLNKNLLFLLAKIDLVKNIEVVVFDNDWDIEANFEKTFSESLLQNKEMLGAAVAKSVGQWIQDFINSSPVALSERTIVNIGNFLVKNSSVSKLSPNEKAFLSEILKLYLWFINGEIDEREVISYKEAVAEAEAKKVLALAFQELPVKQETYVSSVEMSKRSVDPVLSAPPQIKRPAPPVPAREVPRPSMPQRPVAKPPESLPYKPLPELTKKPGMTLGSSLASPSGVNVQDVLYRENANAKRGGLDFKPEDNIPASSLSQISSDKSASSIATPKPVAATASPKPETGLRASSFAKATADKQGLGGSQIKPQENNLDKQVMQSATPGGFPVLKPKDVEEFKPISEKIGYTAKPDDNIDDKLEALKKKMGNK